MPARPNARLVRRQRIILARMGSVTPPPPVPAAAPADVPAAFGTPTASPADELHEPPVVPVTEPGAPPTQDVPPR
jgi:hypothetical protein